MICIYYIRINPNVYTSSYCNLNTLLSDLCLETNTVSSINSRFAIGICLEILIGIRNSLQRLTRIEQTDNQLIRCQYRDKTKPQRE